MSTSIDFKGNKLLGLSIVAVTVALLGTFLSYKASSNGASIEEKVLDGITATTVAGGKDSSATRILPKLKSDSVGGSKIDTDTLLHLPNVSFSSVENGQALNAELKSTLATELGDGVKKRLILFGDKYDPTIASTLIRLKASGEVTIKGPHIETNLTVKDLKEKESIYKGIKTTGIGFGPFNKSEISNIQSNAFPKSTIIQLEDDKYMAILSADLGLGGVNTSDAQNTGGATPPPPPVVTRVIIPATLLINGTNYNLKHAGEELSNSNKDQILEENVPNGKKQTNITLSEGASHNVVGTINNIDLVCNTGYFKYYNTDLNQDVCEEEYIIPGTLNIGGKTYTIAKAGQRLTPANNQSAGTAPTPDNKGTIHANIGLTKGPSKTVVGNILSQNITCQTGYIEKNGGCVLPEITYTLPNAYVGPATGITFNLADACKGRVIKKSDGEITCDAIVEDYRSNPLTLTDSIKVSLNEQGNPVVKFNHDKVIEYTIPNTINHDGHTWNISTPGNTITNKWYGKFKTASMLVGQDLAWGLERNITGGVLKANAFFVMNPNGLVKKLGGNPKAFCNSGFKEQGLSCVADCNNPIYLDTNGVTVKAKACAEAGKTYQWNGENWYVAIDKNDVRNKIFRDNLDREGNGEFKANRVVTSKITNMSSTFQGKKDFNQDVSNWDTSNATSFLFMFSGATSFNQPLDNWDVKKVVTMESMFTGAKAFNQPLNNWETKSLQSLFATFERATSFDQPLNNWDTGNVTNMAGMFKGATAFNQPLNNWNTSKVKSFSSMFEGATAFNGDINNWDVRKVVTMGNMFQGATAFNKPLNNWDTASLSVMSSMFKGATSFNQPLNNWNTSKVNDMMHVFTGAIAFNGDINNWDTSKVTYMSYMFQGAKAFNKPLHNWNTSRVEDMCYMFNGASAFNQNINNWNTSNVTSIISMFNGATSFNQPIGDWNIGKVTSMQDLFQNAKAFNQPLNNWNTSNVKNMRGVFMDAKAFNQDINDWNTSNVREMRQMFYSARAFNQPLNNWNTSNVTKMDGMFEWATSFNQPLNNWNTSKVEDMSQMFDFAKAFNQNISNWDVNKVVRWNYFSKNSPIHLTNKVPAKFR